MTGQTDGASGSSLNGHANVVNNEDSRSYDAVVDGQIAGTIVYERSGDARIVFTHTIVEPAFRGLGVGSALVRGALADVRAQGLTLTNFCEFVGRYMQAHPEYLDLIDPQHPGYALDD